MGAKTLFVRLALAVLVSTALMTLAAAQSANQTATEFYMTYRATFAKAKAIEDVMPFMSKEVRSKIESTPAAERPQMFE
ncbi:hypothetical protein FK515_30670, partial [Klebsiella pneumoniae]|nr:hypothetical protein [Klebsiella pneumoniae]